MGTERIEVLVVGAGQAGIAMSEHLSAAGIPHVVLERSRIAERWRSERWDGLKANGPAWHDRFPGQTYPNTPADAFPGKEAVADYFESYSRRIKAPVRTGIDVLSVRRRQAAAGFVVETSAGLFEAGAVVAATGPFQRPRMPDIVPAEQNLLQLHSVSYRQPAQLPPGAVLVVGAGSSGAQIADELLRSGRTVYLSLGAHDRPPRRYRGRDYCWWLGMLGHWDAEAEPGAEHVPIAVSGARGGETVDYRRFAARGMVLLGRTQSFAKGILTFAPDLRRNLDRGDANYLSVLDEADAFNEKYALGLPEEPEARLRTPDADCIANPIPDLNLAEAGVTSIIWATGFGLDFGWLKLDAFDRDGRPRHKRGVSVEPDLYFLGLPWLSRRGSSFIWGVWHDAKYIADQIAIRRSYMAYSGHAQRLAGEP